MKYSKNKSSKINWYKKNLNNMLKMATMSLNTDLNSLFEFIDDSLVEMLIKFSLNTKWYFLSCSAHLKVCLYKHSLWDAPKEKKASWIEFWRVVTTQTLRSNRWRSLQIAPVPTVARHGQCVQVHCPARIIDFQSSSLDFS